MKTYSVTYKRPVQFHATRMDVSAVYAADAANMAMAQFPDCEVQQVTLANRRGCDESNWYENAALTGDSGPSQPSQD